MEIRTSGTGVQVEVPASKMPGTGHDNMPPFDGNHLWIVTAGWRVNPATFTAGKSVDLDTENLLMVSSPGCFWCEEEWSFVLASKRCKGDASPGWQR